MGATIGLKIPCGNPAVHLHVRNFVHYIRSLNFVIEHTGNAIVIDLQEIIRLYEISFRCFIVVMLWRLQ